MNNDIVLGVPPTSARGRNGRWRRKLSDIRLQLLNGMKVPEGQWIVFASDISKPAATRLAANYRTIAEEFEWIMTGNADGTGTVWCRPKLF